MKSDITISKRIFLTILTCCLFTVSIHAQTAPVVVSRVPAHNATNVGLNSLITVTFDQPIELGIAVRRLKIINTDTGVTFQSYAFSDLTISGNTLTMSHSILPYSTNFHITIDQDFVRNASGQGNSYYGSSTWLFSTESDTYSPVLTAMTPPDGSVGVWENSNLLSYSFNENVQAGSGNIIVKRVDDDAVTLNVDVTNPSNVIVSGSSFTVVSNSSTFDYSTEYYVEFPSGVIEDLLGNPFEGIGSPPLADHNFTMRDAPADTFPPTVDSFSPADNATGVDVNTDFTINFNENVQIGTGSIFVKISSSGTTLYEIDVSSVSITGNTVTFTLPDNLFILTNYFITIDPTAFSDLAGNDYAGISTNIAWNFTTANATDITAPTAILFTPADNATNVSITNDLTANFDEAIQLIGDAVLKNFGGSVIPSTSTVSGSTLTINPTVDLDLNTSYYVEIAYGAIRDLAGNSYTGFSGNTAWNFTTEAVSDTTPPEAVTFTPLDNAINVSITENLTLLFDEAIQLTGSAVLKNIGGSVIPSTSTVSGNMLTINPTSNLENNTQYYVEIANGVIKDIAGNSYVGFSGNSFWNFTAEMTALIATVYTPINNATEVSTTNNLTLAFNRDIQLNTPAAIKNWDTNNVIPSTSTVSGNVLTINPTSDLDANTRYYVIIQNTGIEDLFGNYFAGILNRNFWNFTTEVAVDTTPPTAVTFTPADNAADVSITTNLTLVFDEAIQLTGSAV
ncbi:MAG: Ig-like domain-containing protein, partial [Bacteroidetes bacterium]|nr:Ig-like domain-containing protein [Bacteroidota bacterium]